ncbi:MAG: hypothetical protein JXQ29_02060, partial [Planctomycetes bacterium]|nr:hypothetical protein [Planctomycetota bacterium]
MPAWRHLRDARSRFLVRGRERGANRSSLPLRVACTWVVLLYTWAAGLCGCSGGALAERHWKIETIGRWVHETGIEERAPGDPHGVLPSSPDAVGWGKGGELWILFEGRLGRIQDPVQPGRIE